MAEHRPPAAIQLVGGLGTWAMPIGVRAAFWALLMGWNAVKWQAWFALTVRKPGDWWRASCVGAILLNLSLPIEIKAALALCGYEAAIAPATTIWIEALAISGVLFVLLMLVGRRLRGTKTAEPPPAIRADGLLARAGLPSPAALLAIVAEDHYCRVHQSDGTSALSITASDALDRSPHWTVCACTARRLSPTRGVGQPGRRRRLLATDGAENGQRSPRRAVRARMAEAQSLSCLSLRHFDQPIKASVKAGMSSACGW